MAAQPILNNLIITTAPYHRSKAQKQIWLDRGATIRRDRGIKWIVALTMCRHHCALMQLGRKTKLVSYWTDTGQTIGSVVTSMTCLTLAVTPHRLLGARAEWLPFL
jgi:hypothetical protein